MKDLQRLRSIVAAAKLRDLERGTKLANDSRLQVRVPSDLAALVERLAIVLGCTRAEVLSLALDEFAEKLHPELVST